MEQPQPFAISFVTPGLLDLTAATTMGVNVKETEDAIGYFGTGLKFALAVLLRHRMEVEFWIGHNHFAFKPVSRTIRGKEFQIVQMNGQDLGFTTDLGKDWKLWMAYRELICNTLDEGGFERAGALQGQNGSDETTIIIYDPSSGELEKIWNERDTIILKAKAEPVLDLPHVTIYPKQFEENFIFYKGVRIYEFGTQLKYTYNIKQNLTLTEDRTMAYMHELQRIVTGALQHLPINPNEIVEFLSGLRFHEKYMQWSSYLWKDATYSPQFEEAAPRLLKDPNLPELLRRQLKEIVPEQFPEWLQPMELFMRHPEELRKLRRAAKILLDAGIPLGDYEIRISKNMHDHLYGRAYIAHKLIYINFTTLQKQPVDYIALVLFEEWFHIRYEVGDYTRSFQTLSLKILINALEKPHPRAKIALPED